MADYTTMSPSLKEKITKKKQPIAVQTILIVLIVGLLATLTGLFFSADRSSPTSQGKSATKTEDGVVVFYGTADGTTADEESDSLVGINIKGIDPNKYVASVEAKVLALPPTFSNSTAASELAQPVTTPFLLGLNGNDVNFTSSTAKIISTKVMLENGSLDLYPFDKYATTIYLYSTTDNFTFVVAPAVTKQYGWDFDIDPQPDVVAPGIVGFRFMAKRSFLFKVYPVIMIIAFWAISITVLYLGFIVVLWTSRKVEPPALASVVALMFALPAFRNTAPSGPPFGCALDFLAFYWSLFISIIVLFMFLIKYFRQD